MKVEINMCRRVNGLTIEIRSVVCNWFLPSVMLKGQLCIKDKKQNKTEKTDVFESRIL